MNFTKEQIQNFQSLIWDFYKLYGRDFLWRQTKDPYAILVSEIMLQQTQTLRVIPKYEQWLFRFPTFSELADAPLKEVLSYWQGLGYNRRGKYLQEIAKRVIQNFDGQLPACKKQLEKLPGIGKYTAAAVCTFAFGQPNSFIETNIRTVFIVTFFQDQEKVHDKEILPIIEQTIDEDNPREWYYALMDYGVMLKQQLVNPNRKSAHHTVQSKFEGSDRQIRGMILKILTQKENVSLEELKNSIKRKPERIKKALQQLTKEGFLNISGDVIQISQL